MEGSEQRTVRNELSGELTGQAVQVGTVYGGIHLAGPGARPAERPWQLPPVGGLVGRDSELARLERLRKRAAREGRPALGVITGLGGVGKTVLATAWLHTLRSACPDGQLYADLGARSPAGAPATSEVLGWFLNGLGIPPERVPATAAERVALYRTLTAERRLALLLDDAVSAAQVRPLLPAGRSVVAVTSRWRLSGLSLDGGHLLDLEALDTDAAVELLATTLVDGRVEAEWAEARRLVRLCARLPLAVRVAGARLAARPRRSIAVMVRDLAEERDRLAGLGLHGDHDVRAALDMSYRALPERAARLYRLLGLHPGPEFGRAAAAAALGAPDPADAEDAIDMLHDAHLLTEVSDGRYRFHDLVRLHAVERAGSEDDEARRAARRRIWDTYLATATRAEEILDPHHRTLVRGYGAGPVVAEDFGGAEPVVLAWLETELQNLLAVLRAAGSAGEPSLAWQLADALRPFFLRRKHHDARRAAYREGLAAARACGAVEAEFRMLVSGGLGELDTDAPEVALEMFDQAARLCAESGDELGLARTFNYRGLACHRLGRLADAAALFARAAVECPRHGDERAGGLARHNQGEVALAAGRAGEAAAHATAALDTLTAQRDPYNAARATMLLGRARLADGRLAEAETALDSALASLRGMTADWEVARALAALAELAERQRRFGLARDRCREALAVCAALRLPAAAADELRARLDRLDRLAGPAG
ncbi:ATP-binding protein [Streptomyces litchfieldiae]|uniref:ATP-binding protein n=1 Tax=Streptomyces litchfieldiae TaxID=3075543 RepID=A0ABU2MNI8_9ACTN|nr:ATP-binding protein [Streptomyces sp. DSM 44938]MDT0342957.1 ATP-binding protein [Streptomyces sp. DSM 44938]